MILLLTPFIGASTTHYEHYDMIKFGGYFTGISPFCLVISSTIVAAIVMIIVLSIGESIWSPRTYDYAMSVAPTGREATFAALAAAPLFVAKAPVGLMSGWLLETYMPEDSDKKRNPQMLWFIIGMLTISSPIGITLFEKYIREPLKNSKSSSSGNGSGRNKSGSGKNGDQYQSLTQNIEMSDNEIYSDEI